MNQKNINFIESYNYEIDNQNHENNENQDSSIINRENYQNNVPENNNNPQNKDICESLKMKYDWFLLNGKKENTNQNANDQNNQKMTEYKNDSMNPLDQNSKYDEFYPDDEIKNSEEIISLSELSNIVSSETNSEIYSRSRIPNNNNDNINNNNFQTNDCHCNEETKQKSSITHNEPQNQI